MLNSEDDAVQWVRTLLVLLCRFCLLFVRRGSNLVVGTRKGTPTGYSTASRSLIPSYLHAEPGPQIIDYGSNTLHQHPSTRLRPPRNHLPRKQNPPPMADGRRGTSVHPRRMNRWNPIVRGGRRGTSPSDTPLRKKRATPTRSTRNHLGNAGESHRLRRRRRGTAGLPRPFRSLL